MFHNMMLSAEHNKIARIAIIAIGLVLAVVFYRSGTAYIQGLGGEELVASVVNKQSKKMIKTAALQISPIHKEVGVGEKVTSSINVESKNVEMAGFDVILTYNPSVIKVLDVTPSSQIASTPVKKIDNQKGHITISFLVTPSQSLKGNHEIARISWEALRAGESKMKFDFTPDSTSDSNVAEFATGIDVLTSIVNSEYIITGKNLF